MAELLSYAETKKLLDDLPAEHKKLVEELIPSQISVTGVQRVLQTLLAERVSIRDLTAILEGIAEAVGHTKNALYITEHVRARLARQLCHANLSPGGYLPIVAMSPAWEQAFAESIVGQGEDRQLAMAPSQLQQFITSVRDRFEEASAEERGARAADQSADQAIRALDRRALPLPDRRNVAERNPRLDPLAHAGTGVSVMQLRTFLAKDMKAALANVRTEMGPEAVIVGSERTKGGGVMVRAALEEPETPSN